MGDDEMVDACPQCDCASVRKKRAKMDSPPRTYPEDYRCAECGTHFDEPVVRPRQSTGDLVGGSNMAASLRDADPDTEIRATESESP